MGVENKKSFKTCMMDFFNTSRFLNGYHLIDLRAIGVASHKIDIKMNLNFRFHVDISITNHLEFLTGLMAKLSTLHHVLLRVRIFSHWSGQIMISCFTDILTLSEKKPNEDFIFTAACIIRLLLTILAYSELTLSSLWHITDSILWTLSSSDRDKALLSSEQDKALL